MNNPNAYPPRRPPQSFWQRILHNIDKQIEFLQQNPRYVSVFAIYYLIEVLAYSGGSPRKIPIFALICALYYAVAIVIAMFWGDTIIKLLEGIRPLETKREIEYLTPLFESVYYDVSKTFEDVPRIQLCTIDNLTVNAFALGSHTIAVSRGAIETFSTDELKAVITHEIAHIYYGHSRATLLNALGKGSFTLEIVFVQWVSRKLEDLKPYYIRQRGSFLFWLVYYLHKLHEMIITAFMFLGKLILSGNSRKNEFSADRFAHQAGYGKELTEALYLLQKMSLGDNRQLIQRMLASHPRLSKRIQQLEWLEEQEQEPEYSFRLDP